MTELAAISTSEVARDGRLLVVPLGATEQHGPHLPLGTDTVIAQELVRRLADRRAEVTVAPALAYGSSGEHHGFPGTLSVGAAATETLLVELGRSATETFARVLFLSAHGGNLVAVTRAVARLRTESRDVRAWSPAAVWSGDAHAGEIETSVMLAIAPQTVVMERAAAGNRAPLAELMEGLVRSGVRAVSENGVLGDPLAATAEHGTELVAWAVTALERFLDGWSTAA